MLDWQEFIKEHFANVPFFRFMDVQVVATGHGRAELKLATRPEFANSYGITHGGITTALVDMAGGVALRTLKVRVVTVETAVNFFKPINLEEEIRAEARLVNQGKKLLNAEVDVLNQEGVLVAKGKITSFILGEDTGEY